MGFICAALHLVIIPHFDVNLVDSEEVTSKSFGAKVIYFYIAMTNQRLLYYIPWNIVDGVTHASGLSFAGYDEKQKKP